MSDRESLERIERLLARIANQGTGRWIQGQTQIMGATGEPWVHWETLGAEALALLRALLAEPRGTCRACGRPRDLAYLLMCDDCVRRGVPIPAVSGPGVSRADAPRCPTCGSLLIGPHEGDMWCAKCQPCERCGHGVGEHGARSGLCGAARCECEGFVGTALQPWELSP